MTEPDFAFGKLLGVNEQIHGDNHTLIIAIERLMCCMKETNKIHNMTCEFFRLDFRPQTLNEELCRRFPLGALVLDLKWGSKAELSKKTHA